jgi:adenylate kinase family enzyme
VLGRPGAGKTTACTLIAGAYGYTLLNLEALIKAEAESGSRFGREIAALVALGDQV